MSGAALALGFFDPGHGLYGSARTGATLLFEGARSTVLPEGPAIEPAGEGWTARVPGAFDLEFAPLAPATSLVGVVATACAVTGTVGGETVRCLGTISETRRPPEWERLDAVRSLSALFDSGSAFLAVGRRPRGALGHDAEETVAWLLDGGEEVALEDTRISTVYDGDGRQRSAGLELWVPDEDFPRRIAGTVTAGSSLSLDGLSVHVAIFNWRMDGRDGTGAYELWVRADPEAA